MLPPVEDLERRRPVWERLSDLFLDTELQDYHYSGIAQQIIESGYGPTEVHHILWEEVFPAIEWNLRHPCGVSEGFRVEYLQEAILVPSSPKQTANVQPGTARAIRDAWAEVCRFLPDDFKRFSQRRWWQFWRI